MTPPRKLAVAALALVIGLTTFASAAPAQSRPTGPAPSGNIETVTLITGDHVVLQGERVITVRPGKGRKGAAFKQQKDRGDTYVIPSDAAALVAAGRVDRRLFNVSKLAEYDLESIPVIVTYEATARSARALRSINGDAVKVAQADAAQFWAGVTGPRTLKSGASKLWLDAPVRASLDRSVLQVGAPAAWQAGYTGEGTTVAVLDTGIDTTHPDLADAVIGAQDFSESGSTTDHFGHGTHVAGIITGNGAKYRGVAPDTKLLNGKVLDDFGGGFESGIIAGMEWAAAQGADVINMSLGAGFPSDGTEPMDVAVNQITAETGALFVVSSGNSGPEGIVGSPAAADAALTVGAVDRNDVLADFSSIGPRWEDLAVKPDITAPGVDIVSPLADGALLGQYYPIVDDKYLQLSGTSMAAPHVAGAAAILAGQHDAWDADELKSALMNSAQPRDGVSVYQQGAGRLDVARAVRQSVFATPASLSNGIVRWPHDDDEPIAKTITYHNESAEPITLDLSVNVPDAPPGMFTLDKSQVTVPAHGTATAQVVTDTSVPAADRTYGGAIIAAGGQTTIRTPIGVTREVESYDVSMTIIDRNGAPTSEYSTRFVNIARPEAVLPYDPSGRVVARVPKGNHYFEIDIVTPCDQTPFGFCYATIVEPELAVTGDRELVLDARQAKPIDLAVDRPEAEASQAAFGFLRETSWGDTGAVYFVGSFAGFNVRPSDTAATIGTFRYVMEGHLARPDGSGGFAGSPYFYHVVHTTNGRVPADLMPRIRDRELAKVQTKIANASPGEIVSKDWIVDLPTPATLTEFYTPEVNWYPSLVINLKPEFEFDGVIQSSQVRYRLGRTTTERWNVGVFGPTFPAGAIDGPLAYRGTAPGLGDFMEFYLQLFADQAPNRQGDSRVSTSKLTLSRNGELIGEVPEYYGGFLVPPGPGTYQLGIESSRPSTLSTQVSATWTFDGSADGPLPLMAVRFAPDLDEHNRAKSGRLFTFPVYVQQQEDSPHGKLKRLRVQVSYDDGRTWKPVTLLGNNAILFHPRGKGFVSLRATATDTKGNSLEQTIIRAYELK